MPWYFLYLAQKPSKQTQAVTETHFPGTFILHKGFWLLKYEHTPIINLFFLLLRNAMITTAELDTAGGFVSAVFYFKCMHRID